jgi:hypothetical protein
MNQFVFFEFVAGATLVAEQTPNQFFFGFPPNVISSSIE